MLVGCGGTGGSKSPQNPPPPPPNLGGGQVKQPVPVTVAAGRAVSGIDIAVVAPASTAPPNAEVLGVADLSGPAQAFNTGGTIARGSTRRVLLFGAGLTGSMTVSITGPVNTSGNTDISISNIQGIKATDNTPGVTFTAAVAPNAALGCRTVILQATNGDITVFTGGLEVVP